MLDCVSWDAPIVEVETAFALTLDDRNKETVVVSVSQSGSPGQIISVEFREELEIKVVLGERNAQVPMLLARRLHAEIFKNAKGGALKLMLLLSLKDNTDDAVIPAIVKEVVERLR